VAQAPPSPPPGARTSTLVHRVAFYETDAMGIVHHANYLRFFENARVIWLEEHDRPYTEYIEANLHFAVTSLQVDYTSSARFDERLDITTWAEWVGGASLHMAYRVSSGDELKVSGRTEHAAVDDTGRVRRIPRERRENLRLAAVQQSPSEHPRR